MHPDQFVIDPGTGDVENGAKTQKYSIPHPAGGYLDFPAVNAGAASHPQICELRLPGSRNIDWTPCNGLRSVILDKMKKFPSAVQENSITENHWRVAHVRPPFRTDRPYCDDTVIGHCAELPQGRDCRSEMRVGIRFDAGAAKLKFAYDG